MKESILGVWPIFRRFGTPNQNLDAPLDWVYLVLQSGHDTAEVIEYKRSNPGGRIQATTHQKLQLATTSYRQVRILTQERPGSAFKVAKDPLTPGKTPPLFWIFDSGFIQDLPWDPGDWHWRAPLPLGDAPFFSYTAKRGSTRPVGVAWFACLDAKGCLR